MRWQRSQAIAQPRQVVPSLSSIFNNEKEYRLETDIEDDEDKMWTEILASVRAGEEAQWIFGYGRRGAAEGMPL